MNLVGLILIAALSLGIVAVSLRLRLFSSSDRLGLEGERRPDEDLKQRQNYAWLQAAFGLKSDSRIFNATYRRMLSLRSPATRTIKLSAVEDKHAS